MIKHAKVSLGFLALLLLATAGTWGIKDWTYSEDLAVHRKAYRLTQQRVKQPSQRQHERKPTHVIATHAVTDRLDELLGYKKLANEQIAYLQGYTIQAYAGGSRKEAFRIKNKLYTLYPTMKPEVMYDLPNYVVRLGRFLDKLEAYTVYAAIKRRMPQAIIRTIDFANTPYAFSTKPKEHLDTPTLAVPATDKPEKVDQE